MEIHSNEIKPRSSQTWHFTSRMSHPFSSLLGKRLNLNKFEITNVIQFVHLSCYWLLTTMTMDAEQSAIDSVYNAKLFTFGSFYLFIVFHHWISFPVSMSYTNLLKLRYSQFYFHPKQTNTNWQSEESIHKFEGSLAVLLWNDEIYIIIKKNANIFFYASEQFKYSVIRIYNNERMNICMRMHRIFSLILFKNELSAPDLSNIIDCRFQNFKWK